MILTAEDLAVAMLAVTLQILPRSVGQRAGNKLGAATSSPSSDSEEDKSVSPQWHCANYLTMWFTFLWGCSEKIPW